MLMLRSVRLLALVVAIPFAIGVTSLQADKVNQTIAFDPLPAKTYGDASFVLAAVATSGLPVTFTSGNPTIATIDGSTVTIRGAGTTTITASQPGDDACNPAADVPQVLTVNKKELTVTANNQVRLPGQPNPEFTLHYDGFVLAETECVLDNAPVATCDAVQNSLPGDFPINVAGGDDDNYEFVYHSGNLTVLAQAPAESDPTPTIAVEKPLPEDIAGQCACPATTGMITFLMLLLLFTARTEN